jgi:HD superfamily phosphodiesterase
MISEIERIVEEACARETNIFGYGIWTHHITLVAHNAKRLARLFNADPEIVEIAALLHDYASIKDPALYQDHHLHGSLEAEKILQQLGYPPAKIEAIKHCIASHRGSVPAKRNSAEAECLANADAVTHIEQVPSLLHLVFVQRGLGIDEGTQWVREKLERSWNKLSPPVQALLRQRYEAVLQVLTAKPVIETN